MEPLTMEARRWEDVVFENRNKGYGAYLLRRAYAGRVLTGLSVTLVAMTLVLVYGRLFVRDTFTAEIAPRVLDRDIRLGRTPEIERRVKEPKRAGASQQNNLTQKIVVTTDSVSSDSVQHNLDPDVYSDLSGVGEGTAPASFGTIPLSAIETIPEPRVRDHAEVMPAYEGGMEGMIKFIQKKIRYPRAPREQGIQGIVFVRFVVSGDGSVSDVEVIKGVHPDYDKEAVRVISLMQGWRGGSHNGRPVDVRMVVPLRFNLAK